MRRTPTLLVLLGLTCGCRQILGIDEDALASKEGPSTIDPPFDNATNPDPGWARWRVPADVTPRYEVQGGILRDAVTRLVWQRASVAPMDWEHAKGACESLSLAGQAGFRLPTRIELLSIIDFDTSLNESLTYFSEQFLRDEVNCHWTTSGETDQISHWAFIDVIGVMAILTKDSQKCAARCVQGGPYDYAKSVPPKYVIENGVIRDPGTRLEWQARDASSKDQLVSSEAAERECRGLRLLDHADWRLPTIKELATLVDERRALPALDPAVYGESDVYWTSTEHSRDPDGGVASGKLLWRISFADGTTSHADDRDLFSTGIAMVRCVRDY